DQAIILFQQGFSCSQAVCAAYAPSLGLAREFALKIAAGFGGGMGRQGEVCGAVTGAIMAIGLKTGPIEATATATKENTYALTQQLIEQFKARHGTVLCRELLGCDLNRPEGLQHARETQLFTKRCPQFVQDAAEIASTLIEGKE
ncbi:MAG TPA: C-GCAxxG-C-C family protein, partial [Anaerolineae bacterium]|nr:C-GCAxxG-C-C family protein [Anaerolineae bacterium]